MQKILLTFLAIIFSVGFLAQIFNPQRASAGQRYTNYWEEKFRTGNNDGQILINANPGSAPPNFRIRSIDSSGKTFTYSFKFTKIFRDGGNTDYSLFVIDKIEGPDETSGPPHKSLGLLINHPQSNAHPLVELIVADDGFVDVTGHDKIHQGSIFNPPETESLELSVGAQSALINFFRKLYKDDTYNGGNTQVNLLNLDVAQVEAWGGAVVEGVDAGGEGACEVTILTANQEGSAKGSTEKRVIKSGIGIIIVKDLVCWMMQSVTAIVDRMLNWSIRNFLFPAIGLSGVPGGKSVSQEVKTLPLVQDIWKINIVLADTILILVLIFVAIVNIARVSIDTYAIKKILPNLILATILAHFSILITQLIIESSEVLVVNFVPGNIDTMSQQLATAVGFVALYNAVGASFGLLLFAGFIATISFSLLPIILTLVLALMMWFRHLALYFLVAFAPIAIIMMALPVTEKIFKQWLSIFLRVTYLSTIAVIFIFYAIEIGIKGFGQADSFLGSVAPIAGALGMLFLAIFVPISIGKGVPGLGSVFGGIGNMLKKGGGLVGKGAGKKADTMFAGATSGNTWIPGLRQMNQRLGKFAPLKAIGVGSYAGASGIGLYKGWQQNADRRWNQRIGEEAGRGEDIRELSTHLGKVLGIRAGGPKQRGDSWKQISEAANSRYNETKRTQLLTESRTMGNDELTSDDAITRTAESEINNGNQHEAQRALLAARGRNLPNTDNLWQQYLNKFDKQGVTGPEEKRTVSVETLAFQEMLAYEAEKGGGFHEQRFGMNDKGQVIHRSDNEVTDLLVKSARKQLNNTTGKKRQQVVKNIVIHAADDETGLLGTPADRGTATQEFNATQHAMREVLTEHFPTGGIEQAAGDDLIHTKNLKTKVDIKGVEEQLFQEAVDDEREGKSRRTSWNEAVEKAQGVAAGMGGAATPPPPGGTPPPPTP